MRLNMLGEKGLHLQWDYKWPSFKCKCTPVYTCRAVFPERNILLLLFQVIIVSNLNAE